MEVSSQKTREPFHLPLGMSRIVKTQLRNEKKGPPKHYPWDFKIMLYILPC